MSGEGLRLQVASGLRQVRGDDLRGSVSCRWPFEARMLVFLTVSGSPAQVVTRPPASSTKSQPAAKSQGASANSK